MASASRPAGVSLMKSTSAVFIGRDSRQAREPARFYAESPPRRRPCQGPGAAAGRRLADDDLQALRARLVARLVHPSQQLARRLRHQRPAEQKALRVLALLLLQKRELREVLHALGGHVDAQRARHGDDGGRDGAIVVTFGDAADERAVDLEPIHREVPQAAETRVAGAKVVDGEGDTELLELVDGLLS